MKIFCIITSSTFYLTIAANHSRAVSKFADRLNVSDSEMIENSVFQLKSLKFDFVL